MHSLPRLLVRCVVGVAIAVALARASAAQRHPWEWRTIAAIEIVGNERIPDEAVLARIGTAVGEAFDARVLSADLRALCSADGWFADARVDGFLDGDRLTLRFIVREPPLVTTVRLRGIREQREDDVRAALAIDPPRPVSDARADARTRDLADWYREKGHAHVQIAWHRDAGTLVVTIDEGPLTRVDTVRLLGTVVLPAREVTAALSCRRGEPYRAADVDAVEGEIEFEYARRGFLDARARLVDVDWSTDYRDATIIVEVDAGERYHVRSISFAGAERFTDAELRARTDLRPGDPYDRDALVHDARAVLDHYRHHAWIDVRLAGGMPDIVHSLDDTTVAVVYRVVEGVPVRLRRIRIEGNVTTRDRVILREFDATPGEWIDQRAIDRALRRLRDRGYFASIGAEWVDTDEPDRRDLVVRVEEHKTGKLNFAIATDLDQGATAALRFDKRNFDLFGPNFTGGGQRLQAEVAPGTEFNAFRVRFTEPSLLGTPWSVTIGGRRRAQRYDTYRTAGTAGDIAIGRRLDRDLGWDDRLDVGLAFGIGSTDFEDRDRTDDVTVPIDPWRVEQVIRTRRLTPTVRYRGGWDVVDGVRGLGLAAGLDYGTGSLHYLRWTARVDATIRLAGEDPTDLQTLRLEASTGWYDRIGGTDVIPLSERFFVGGSRTLRGLDYQGVGPRGYDGRIAGGEAMWAATAEWQFPILRDDLRGVLFTDAGSLGNHPFDDEFNRTRITAGFGIRVRLFDVPIGIDVGFPILRQRDDDRRLLGLVGEIRF